MPMYKCEAFRIKRLQEKRTICNKPFWSEELSIDKIKLPWCMTCISDTENDPVEKKLRTKKVKKDLKKILKEKHLKRLEEEKDIKKGWLFDKPLFSGDQIDKGWEFILGVIVIVIIGIIIAVSQESNDYRNESLPGRYGYSISKVSSHI